MRRAASPRPTLASPHQEWCTPPKGRALVSGPIAPSSLRTNLPGLAPTSVVAAAPTVALAVAMDGYLANVPGRSGMVALPLLRDRGLMAMPVPFDGITLPVPLAFDVMVLVNRALVNLVPMHLNVLRHDLVVLDLVMLPVSRLIVAPVVVPAGIGLRREREDERGGERRDAQTCE